MYSTPYWTKPTTMLVFLSNVSYFFNITIANMTAFHHHGIKPSCLEDYQQGELTLLPPTAFKHNMTAFHYVYLRTKPRAVWKITNLQLYYSVTCLITNTNMAQHSNTTEWSLELYRRLRAGKAHIALTYGIKIQTRQHSTTLRTKPKSCMGL